MGQQFLDLALDTLIDSAKVFGFAFVIYVVLSFFESKIAAFASRKSKAAPIAGAAVGLIPQCGVSVVASSMFLEEALTMGTLVAVFFACSDEALPILFSDVTGKWYMGFVLLGIKFVLGAALGLLIDLFAKRKELKDASKEEHVGCCGHHIEEEKDEPWYHEHLLHPLWHSFKLFLYAYVIAFLFGTLIILIGEENVRNFLISNRYLSPLLSTLVGLVPNCASSVLISELYVGGGLPFGALLSGLCVNAGLGMLYLFRHKKNWKQALGIMGILIVASIAAGYMFIWIG